MSVVSLLNVKICNNPATFTSPYQFEITFECLENLREDLEWKLTYVGSATSSEHDQELDSLLVGPVPIGVNKFIFQADPPDLSRIPSSELLGVTVILLTCSYDGREFVRVGYYVNNQYPDQFPELQADPPAKPIIEKIERNILADKPRVTRFAIKWYVDYTVTLAIDMGGVLMRDARDSDESAPAEFPPDQPEADTVDDDGDLYGAEEEEEEVEEVVAVEAEGDDTEMGGAEEGADVKVEVEEEDDDDAGSEDLEAESDGDDEEELEDEEGEGEEEADEEMEMGEDETKPANGAPIEQNQQQEMMVH
ncbi:histone deposition protein Asf1 [Eremomyces bilateralis CBS 781.70]|uniref:Anti-silencing function protein 1 n=1 Tax=Eremomyces bilateralis CBS 781.70 TaxID=1392243 RepID=A0A6G1FZS4_9PEZI|nr:histone deposition protein Asf1 [Eremomyces bilateralis CBS 781.70]KAF1811357.1 histone deposition protein Asf1 [Eremomyces bilateralis CBS 781.70]